MCITTLSYSDAAFAICLNAVFLSINYTDKDEEKDKTFYVINAILIASLSVL